MYVLVLKEIHFFNEMAYSFDFCIDPPNAPSFKISNSSVSASSFVTVVRGTDLNIECIAISNPTPKAYTWILPDGSKTAGDILHLANLQSSGNNVYSCTAANEMVPTAGFVETGRNTSYITLKILGCH